jgi:GT2 family glycosyltransferase
MKSLAISVIICTKNRVQDFKNTVVSLTRQNRLPDELIVIDSSDNTAIKEFITSGDFPFESCYFHVGPGLTYARNIGIQQSNGDLLLFFDDDVELELNYISYVEQVFLNDEHNEIGAVGGRILNESSEENTTPFSYFKRKVFDFIRYVFLLSRLGSGRFRYSGMPTQPHASSESSYIECLSGGCMAFRREVFGKVRFDEKLIGYGHVEDADISKQILTAGYKIYYEARAALDHFPSSEDRPKAKKLAELTVVNYAYFFRKHWPQTWVRKASFWWALIGLCLVFIPGSGWQGVLNGIRQISRVNH